MATCPVENAGATAAVTSELEECTSCIDCGSCSHDLVMCPDITAEQLGEILIQLQDMELDEGEGAMIFQNVPKGAKVSRDYEKLMVRGLKNN